MEYIEPGLMVKGAANPSPLKNCSLFCPHSHSPPEPLHRLTPMLYLQPLLQSPLGMSLTPAGASSGVGWCQLWQPWCRGRRRMRSHCGTRTSMTLAFPMGMQGWAVFPMDLMSIFLRGKTMCCLASTGPCCCRHDYWSLWETSPFQYHWLRSLQSYTHYKP